MKKSKKILSLLLAVVMLFSALSAGIVASAADVPAPNYSKRVTAETMTDLLASVNKLAKDNLNPLIEQNLFTNSIIGTLNSLLVPAFFAADSNPSGSVPNAAYGLFMTSLQCNYAMKATGLYTDITEIINIETGALTEKGKELVTETKDESGNVTAVALSQKTLDAIANADYGVKDIETFKAALTKTLEFVCSNMGLPTLLGPSLPLTLYSLAPVIFSVIEESVGIDLDLPAKAEMDKAYEEASDHPNEPTDPNSQWPCAEGTYLAGVLVDAVVGLLDDLMTAPATFLVNVLPNLANFITGQNGIDTATNNPDLMGLADVIGGVASLMPMFGLPEDTFVFDAETCDINLKINDQAITVKGTTLTNYTTDEEFTCIDVAGLVSALLPVIVDLISATEGAPDLSALEGLKLPAIDWALLAERGTKVKHTSEINVDKEDNPCTYTTVEADTADALMTIFDYIYKALIADADNFQALYKTLDAAIPASDSKATIMSVVGGLGGQKEEQVILKLIKLLPGDDTDEPSTEGPSENPSEEPSETPSENPSNKPTDKPSDKPTEGGNGNNGNNGGNGGNGGSGSIDVGDAAISAIALAAVAAAAAFVISKKKKD